MNAHEFLKEISPDDDFGVREKLQKHLLICVVESIMEKYAEYKINELNSIVYKARLSEVRLKLEKRKIRQPRKMMIEMGLWISKDEIKDWNYLGGRTKNLEFLEALEKLEDSLE